MKKLLIFCGEEGVGKSTLTKAILPELKNGVAFDAENILQVNPFEYGDSFQELAVDTSARLVNAYFDHGYEQVVGASFLNEYQWLEKFQNKLTHECEVSLVMLITEKKERDERRMARNKNQSQEDLEYIDNNFSITSSLKEQASDGGYVYYELDTTDLSIEESISKLKEYIYA